MRLSLAVVVAAAIVVACAAGAHKDHHAPSGYDRIGTADGATLYARQDRSGEGSLSVFLQARDGGWLCNSRAPLSPDPAPPLCDDHVPGAYSFVLPVAKGGPGSVSLCDRLSGAPVPVPVVRTPEGWPVDFAVAVRRTTSGDDGSGINRC